MYTASGTVDKQATVAQYAPLVRRLAHHLAARLPASVEIDDIIQAGLMGLMDAAGRYQQDQGAQFETYATQRIRGAMLDELRQNDWLPRGVRSAQRRIEQALTKVEQRLGRAASEAEVARELGLSLGAYQELLQEAKGYQLVYFDDFGSHGEDDEYLDRNLPDEAANPFKQLEDQRFRTALIELIEALPEREKLVMGLYYEQELNFREIAAVLGVTESRICQIHTQAIARVRAKLKGWRDQETEN
jgi:RNA polymerase sigma factor FliA